MLNAETDQSSIVIFKLENKKFAVPSNYVKEISEKENKKVIVMSLFGENVSLVVDSVSEMVCFEEANSFNEEPFLLLGLKIAL